MASIERTAYPRFKRSPLEAILPFDKRDSINREYEAKEGGDDAVREKQLPDRCSRPDDRSVITSGVNSNLPPA
jgi:hypothetical protein